MFPAYKNDSTVETSATEPLTSKEFLQNPSYDTIPVTSSTVAQLISSDSDSSDSEGEIKDDSKNVQVYKKKSPSPPKVEYFYVDTDRKKEYLKLNFLPNRAVPFYKITRNFKRFAQSKRTFRRYFKVKRIKKMLQDPVRMLDEKVEKDEELRIFLIKNSEEVDKWIEYIEYKVRNSRSFKEKFSLIRLFYNRKRCR